MQLTAEQEAILRSTGNLRINTVAGSGKTTTLMAYAASRPAGSRILYLAFTPLIIIGFVAWKWKKKNTNS